MARDRGGTEIAMLAISPLIVFFFAVLVSALVFYVALIWKENRLVGAGLAGLLLLWAVAAMMVCIDRGILQ